MGLSGAFGAVGADFTTASTNPAGLGLYKSSEFINTPAVHIGNVQSEANGLTGSDSRTNFYMGNIGLVMTSKVKSDPNKAGFKYVTFATGLNRLNDFNRRYEMNGTNSANSLLDIYVNDAKGTDYTEFEQEPPYGPFDLSLAWYTYLINPAKPNVTDEYTSAMPNGNKLQSKYIDSWGSMNEYVFSFATNYNDRLYLGLTFGIPFIRYYESSVYTENSLENSNLNNFDRIETLETRGSGFNIKAGFIYRASDWFRIGGAFHSPSWFGNMTDYWHVTMTSDFNNPPDTTTSDTYFVRNSASGTYDYNLNTPLRVQGDLAFIIGNVGLISADYEFADYGSAHLDARDFNFNEENQAIQNSYTGTHQVRIGTEWRYKIFSFRAGGKYSTSPYKNNINEGSRFGFSGGIGLKQGWFFMDLAYAYRNMKDNYYFYNSSGFTSNPISNTTIDHSILLTLGVKL
jgi:hypothetical protein